MWQCYYYGNNGSWSGNLPCFLPTGSSGLAESSDGINWTRVPGKLENGAILGPGPKGTWDSVQTGVGDVVRVGDELHMYYFGGDDEPLSMGPSKIVGFRMRIGRAVSKDNGRSWTKDASYCLDVDESEGMFCSWPKILVEENNNMNMFYHSFDGKRWRVFGASSTDSGETWTRTGLVLEGTEGEFDHQGIGTRSILPWKKGTLMIYEGVDEGGTHALGAAFREPGSSVWTKLNEGKPILEPGKAPLGEWTTQVIGTPHVVAYKDGLRLYHCGKIGPEGSMAIGMIESESGDVEPKHWKVVQ